ncbi:hypothetical protein [Streptomyces sp. KS_5]|uniref:hypothetical protein n=1 Tax=Streptomyces TaxID=1883 RepID=UPI0011600451|nr:hypothetical protein [Streptomyces sp. KS_5]
MRTGSRHAPPAPPARIDHAPPTDRITHQRTAVERDLLRTAAAFDITTVSAPDVGLSKERG